MEYPGIIRTQTAANAPTPEKMLGEVEARLERNNDRLIELILALEQVADRTFGCVPVEPTPKATESPAPFAFARIGAQLAGQRNALDRLARVAERFVALA